MSFSFWENESCEIFLGFLGEGILQVGIFEGGGSSRMDGFGYLTSHHILRQLHSYITHNPDNLICRA